MGVLTDIASSLDELSAGEERVARFIAEQPHRVGHLSAARLGAAVGASDATVVRTVRALGFSGLAELREAVAADLSIAARLGSTLTPVAEPGSRVASLVAERAAVAADLPARLDPAAIDAAVDAVATAERVVAVGFGPSGFLAGYLAHQCRRLGAPSLAITATGRDLADELLALGSGDAVVLLSYQPRAVAPGVVVDRADAVGAAVVLVTDRPAGDDDRIAVTLPVGRGDPRRFASHVATIAVLEALALALADRHRPRAEAASSQLAELRDALERRRRGRRR